jgi:hypothetical protein
VPRCTATFQGWAQAESGWSDALEQTSGFGALLAAMRNRFATHLPDVLLRETVRLIVAMRGLYAACVRLGTQLCR